MSKLELSELAYLLTRFLDHVDTESAKSILSSSTMNLAFKMAKLSDENIDKIKFALNWVKSELIKNP